MTQNLPCASRFPPNQGWIDNICSNNMKGYYFDTAKKCVHPYVDRGSESDLKQCMSKNTWNQFPENVRKSCNQYNPGELLFDYFNLKNPDKHPCRKAVGEYVVNQFTGCNPDSNGKCQGRVTFPAYASAFHADSDCACADCVCFMGWCHC